MNQARCNWCVPIVLLSIWYNVCACHSPVYHYIAATVVYLVQRIMAGLFDFTKRLQRLYLARMNSHGGCWVVWKSFKKRFSVKYLHQVSYLRLQDVIGVCLSYSCPSGTTCMPVLAQYITTSLLLLSTWYTVS